MFQISIFGIPTNSRAMAISWGNGDFDGDGVVDVSDFNVWNSNKFTRADMVRRGTGTDRPGLPGSSSPAHLAVVPTSSDSNES